MRCRTCQREFPADVEFCPKDGTKLVAGIEPRSADPLIGAVLEGRYRIIERVDAGGFGTLSPSTPTSTSG